MTVKCENAGAAAEHLPQRIVGKLLLTPREVAGQLHVALSTVYKLMNLDQLPYVVILSDRRIEPGAVEAFIARQRKAPRTSRPR